MKALLVLGLLGAAAVVLYKRYVKTEDNKTANNTKTGNRNTDNIGLYTEDSTPTPTPFTSVKNNG